VIRWTLDHAHRLLTNFERIKEQYPTDSNMIELLLETSHKLQDVVPILSNLQTEVEIVSATKNQNVGNISDQLWLKIFSYLSSEDLLNVCCVSTDWKRLSESGNYYLNFNNFLS
jgi:hypothetical protein